MVTVKSFSRKENKEGKEFITLELQGDPVFVQNKQTGKYYMTAKSASISTTFDAITAQSLLGREIPGRIEKVPCDEYSITDETTGEVITISHRYEYLPEGATVPLMAVVSNQAA